MVADWASRDYDIRAVDITKIKVVAGVNTHYEDSARFENITIHDSSMMTPICDRYTGNNRGDEPSKTGTGPDATHCIYLESDIHRLP